MKERQKRLLFNDAVNYDDYTASAADKLNMSMEWSDTDKRQQGVLGEKPEAVTQKATGGTGRKTRGSDILSAIDPRRALNPGLHVDMPTANRLS